MSKSSKKKTKQNGGGNKKLIRKLICSTSHGMSVTVFCERGDPASGIVFSQPTSNNDPTSPGFIALNVPCRYNNERVIGQVSRGMDFISTRTLKHGDTVQTHDMYLILNIVEGARKEELLDKIGAGVVAKNKPLFEVVPQFKDIGDPNEWGILPLAPEGRSELVEEILDVWRSNEQKGWCLFLDGNIRNVLLSNLKCMDLPRSLKKAKEWAVDWDLYLNDEQRSYVYENNKYFYKITTVLFGGKSMCAVCGLIDKEKLFHCSKCKRAWYCSKEHQEAHKVVHYPVCAVDEEYRKNTIRYCAQCQSREHVEPGRMMDCCSMCKKAFYCGRDCQLAHWPVHKQVCEQLREG